MAYKDLKSAIEQAIKQNGNQEITGNLLQSTLLNIVDVIGADYKFLGFATPSTIPPTSEEGRLLYFTAGHGDRYINFPTSANGTYITLEYGIYALTREANSKYWRSDAVVPISQESGTALDKIMSQKAVSDKLNDLVMLLKAEFSYKGIAQPTTDPGVPDSNVFYIAGEGSYPNFNNQVVEAGQIAVLKWDGSWHKETIETCINYKLIPLDTVGYIDIHNNKILYQYNNENYSYSAIYPTTVDKIKISAENTLDNVVTIAYLDEKKEFIPELSVTTCNYENEIINLNQKAKYFAVCGLTKSTKVEIIDSPILKNLSELSYIREMFGISKYNLLDNVKVTKGYYLNGNSNWSPTAHYDFLYTDYISVTGGEKLRVWCERRKNVSGIVVYDENKNVINSYTEPVTSVNKDDFAYEEITLDSNARFIRLTGVIRLYHCATIKAFPIVNFQDIPITKQIDVSLPGYLCADGAFKGQETVDVNWRKSDFVYIHGVKKLHYDIVGKAEICGIRFYDEYRKLLPQSLKTSPEQSIGDINIPENAYWVKVSGATDKVIVTYETTNSLLSQQKQEQEQFAKEKIDSDIIKYNIFKSPMNLLIFRKILFIGDSVTAGAIADDTSGVLWGGKHSKSLSYPTRVQQITGIECINNGFSGISVYDWMARFGQPEYGDKVTECDLAVIELGWCQDYSDLRSWPKTQQDFETRFQNEVKRFDNDYNNYDVSNQSPIASYCKLIKLLQNANPNITIICVASMGWNYATTSYVKQISEWAGNNVLFADLSIYFPDGYDGFHFTAKGYCEKAMIAINVFNNVIENNFNKIGSAVYANNPLTT